MSHTILKQEKDRNSIENDLIENCTMKCNLLLQQLLIFEQIATKSNNGQ